MHCLIPVASCCFFTVVVRHTSIISLIDPIFFYYTHRKTVGYGTREFSLLFMRWNRTSPTRSSATLASAVSVWPPWGTSPVCGTCPSWPGTWAFPGCARSWLLSTAKQPRKKYDCDRFYFLIVTVTSKFKCRSATRGGIIWRLKTVTITINRLEVIVKHIVNERKVEFVSDIGSFLEYFF